MNSIDPKVSPNFLNALDSLIKGYSYYHSTSDALVAKIDGTRFIFHPSPDAPTFTLELSSDKKTLTLSYNIAKWGAKNRALVAIERFGINHATHQTTSIKNSQLVSVYTAPEGSDWIKEVKLTFTADLIQNSNELKKSKQNFPSSAVNVKFVSSKNNNSGSSNNNTPNSPSKKDIRSFEEIWGLTNRNIAAQTSEFYLLSVAALKNKDKYEAQYKEYAREFAELLKNYLAMACGGELRHTRHSDEWIESFRNSDKVETWRAWHSVYFANPLETATKAANEFFRKGAWGGAFGGPAWGRAAKYLAEFLDDKHSPTMFVDLVIDLEHNTGCIFNKWFETSRLKQILNAKFRGTDKDYELLLAYATNSKIKAAYVGEAVESAKYQRKLAKSFDLEKLVTLRPYRQCAKCEREMGYDEKVCRACITCPRCHEVISLPLLSPLLPEYTYHTCDTIKIELPSIEYVR